MMNEIMYIYGREPGMYLSSTTTLLPAVPRMVPTTSRSLRLSTTTRDIIWNSFRQVVHVHADVDTTAAAAAAPLFLLLAPRRNDDEAADRKQRSKAKQSTKDDERGANSASASFLKKIGIEGSIEQEFPLGFLSFPPLKYFVSPN